MSSLKRGTAPPDHHAIALMSRRRASARPERTILRGQPTKQRSSVRLAASGGHACRNPSPHQQATARGDLACHAASSGLTLEDQPPTTTPEECAVLPPYGFSFTPAGLLFPYYIGVAARLHEEGLLTDTTPVAGTSAGSIIAVSIASGVPYSTILDANKRLQSDLIENGHLGRVADVLRRFLHEILPSDIHIRATGRVCIGITSLDPYESMEITDWESKEDLIEAVLASSFVPWWISKDTYMEYRGRLTLDGAPTIFLNDANASKCVSHVRICAIPSSRLGLSNKVDICPDLQGRGRKYSWAKLSWMALNPCPEDVMDELYRQGYRDAEKWVETQDQCVVT